MSDNAHHLAEKLLSEGERTLTFFRALPDEAWRASVYTEGAQWTIRQAFEHLCISEHGMRRLCEEIVHHGGKGAPDDFDIDAYNKSRTDRFGDKSSAELLGLFDDTRRKSAAFARGLTDDQLAMRGRHPAMGDSSISDILKMMYLHNTMHVKDIKKVL